MTPAFLQGFFSAMLLEAIILAAFQIVQRYRRLRAPRCPQCGDFLRTDGRAQFPLWDLHVCLDCGGSHCAQEKSLLRDDCTSPRCAELATAWMRLRQAAARRDYCDRLPIVKD